MKPLSKPMVDMLKRFASGQTGADAIGTRRTAGATLDALFVRGLVNFQPITVRGHSWRTLAITDRGREVAKRLP